MKDWSATKAQLYEAFDCLPDGIALLDAEDRFLYWNQRYRDLYPGGGQHLSVGLHFEAFVRASLAAGDTRFGPGTEERWIEERMARHALPLSISERMTCDGRWIRASERRTRDGGTIGIRSDVTELKEREASFRLLFEANPLPMMIYDLETLGFLSVNAAALALYKWDAAWFASHTIVDIRPERDRADLVAFLRREDPGVEESGRQWTHVDAEGRELSVLPVRKTLTFEGRPAVLCCIIDMTERMRVEAQLEHARTHDLVTDLVNLEYVRTRWPKITAAAWGRTGHMNLVRLRVTDLGFVGDVEDGDARATADAIRSVVADEDVVARLARDEFIVLHASGRGPQESAMLAARIAAAVRRTRPEKQASSSSPNILAGIASASASRGDVTTAVMLRESGLALERAKADPTNAVRFFEDAMDKEARRRIDLTSDLRRAIETDGLEVHYQPLVEVASGRIHGFEALLRWRRGDGRLVSPSEFIPLAEETGLIVPMGAWVMRRACLDAVAWPDHVSVAVNLSPAQFRSTSVDTVVADALRRSGLAPRRLEVEVTETLLLADNAENARALHAIREMGVGVALDDFGTGYSSLSYLCSFPFTKIKIDRSFVAGLGQRSECLAVVRAAAQIGADLGMLTTAEGVETAAQFEAVGRLGCTQAQGYLFSPALPLAGATDLLRAEGLLQAHRGDRSAFDPPAMERLSPFVARAS